MIGNPIFNRQCIGASLADAHHVGTSRKDGSSGSALRLRWHAGLGEQIWSGSLGLITAVVGVVSIWFLWYWNVIGYRF
jgi:hypothetical protein